MDNLYQKSAIPYKNLHFLLPYIVAGMGLMSFILLALCCFSKSFRDCCCRWFCCDCCCSKSREESVNRSREGKITDITGSRSGSKSRSNSAEKVRITQPVIPPSTQPSKYHMLAAAKTQKYIGNLLANRRGSYQQQNTSPNTAPPAAKQVARTAKIIGNILAPDQNKRRHT